MKKKKGSGCRKEKILVREFKKSPGSTRAATGIFVTKIVGGRREMISQRKWEEVLEKTKF